MHLIIALIIAAILAILGAALLVAGYIKARGAENPVDHLLEPRDFMTPEEQEALENKGRLQREMHERGRGLRSKLSNRINQ